MAQNQTFQKKNLYKDFDINFSFNPLTNDLAVKKDEKAIIQSIRNLINTNFYDRPFNPDLGCNIRGLLFEIADPITLHELKEAIRETIVNNEPRVSELDIYVNDMSDRNAYDIRIRFVPVMTEAVTEFNLILERLR